MTIHNASNNAIRPGEFERRHMRFGRRLNDVVAGCEHDSETDCLRASPFVLDDRRKVIACDGDELPLTKKEYLLLNTLLASPGTVFSSRELAKHLWPDCPPHCIDTKEVEVKQFIYTLRGKIDKAADKRSWIQTVRGFGYLLSTSR